VYCNFDEVTALETPRLLWLDDQFFRGLGLVALKPLAPVLSWLLYVNL
jgi:hypothetical protein